MDDTQVWTDLEQFAAAMKRGAKVVFNDSAVRSRETGKGMDFNFVRDRMGIKEIIEPPQKKVRPLNAEEWRGVMFCIIEAMPPHWHGRHTICIDYSDHAAKTYALAKATCHPPGYPNDIRKLWVEE